MNTFRDVIALWPTPDVMANEIGVGNHAARHWKTRDFIPAWHWERVLDGARAKGARLSANDFVRFARKGNGKS
jgi:hypothetical protein